VQHLFMQHPRTVFLVGSLALLLLLLLAFTAYHAYLIAVNQTTNERFKLGGLHHHVTNNNNQPHHSAHGESSHAWNFYDRGFFRNLWEVFCPLKPKGKAVSKDSSSIATNGQNMASRGRDIPRSRLRRKV
jgi:hypothetical protein